MHTFYQQQKKKYIYTGKKRTKDTKNNYYYSINRLLDTQQTLYTNPKTYKK